MSLSPYFLRWHYPDQVREATLMDFLGYDLSFLGTPTDNGKKVIIQSYSQKRLKKKRWRRKIEKFFKRRFICLHVKII